MRSLTENLAEVARLLKIHTEIAGSTPGRKYRVEVLNKSAIVLLVACWEAFIEDLAEAAFGAALSSTGDSAAFPPQVLTLASRPLKNSKDERDVWALAGDGWKVVLASHKEKIFRKYTERFNTPSADRIDELYDALLGINSLSSSWSWHTVRSTDAKRKLHILINRRGEIAHRVKSTSAINKLYVTKSVDLVAQLAVSSHNAVLRNLTSTFKVSPWSRYKYD